jgi:hypothetical protein
MKQKWLASRMIKSTEYENKIRLLTEVKQDDMWTHKTVTQRCIDR